MSLKRFEQRVDLEVLSIHRTYPVVMAIGGAGLFAFLTAQGNAWSLLIAIGFDLIALVIGGVGFLVAWLYKP